MRYPLLIILLVIGFSRPTNGQTEKENALLEALGGFSALMVYNTYIVIGATADGYASEIYDKEMAAKLAQEQIASMDNLIAMTDKLLAPGILSSASDKEYVQEVRNILSLLKDEGTALKRYIENGDDSDQEMYQQKRNSVWNKIAKLLGLEK